METQNVSAQLFAKHLPSENLATSTGCKYDPKYYTLCVDDAGSDASIENAFQQQLNLTEYYKSPQVFESMKKNFMDQTMDYNDAPVIQPVIRPQPISEPMLPVGPTDYFPSEIRETFGEKKTRGNRNGLMFILFLILILLFYCLTNIKNES